MAGPPAVDTSNTGVGGVCVGRRAVIVGGNGEVSVGGYGLFGGFVGVGAGDNIGTRVAGQAIGLTVCGNGVGAAAVSQL